MATASAAGRRGELWHWRATWSAREDRTPSAVWLAVLWVGMVAGFGVDLPGFLHRNPPAPHVVHVHAFIFTGWMVILTAQVLLVMGNRVAWHRRLGWFAAGWAGLMAIFGPWAAIASHVAALGTRLSDTPFISVNAVDIGGFLVLLAWGISLRKNPAAHKRLMILATVSLADPGFSRFSSWLIPAEPSSFWVWVAYTFYGNLLLVALMAGWDWWKGRLMPQFALGAAGLVGAELAAAALYYWHPWREQTLRWVEAWAGR